MNLIGAFNQLSKLKKSTRFIFRGERDRETHEKEDEAKSLIGPPKKKKKYTKSSKKAVEKPD